MNPATVNVFGKHRGHFDEQRARQVARAQPDLALSSVACMGDEQFRIFVDKFNQVFGPRPGLPGWTISRTGEKA